MKKIYLVMMLAAIVLAVFMLVSPSWAFELSLGASGAEGTTDEYTASGAIEQAWEAEGAYEGAIYLKGEYGKYEGEEYANELEAGIWHDPELTEKWSLWGYATAGSNRIYSIEQEFFVGGGGKFTFLRSDALTASVSVGPVYQDTRYTYDVTEQEARLSWRGKVKTGPLTAAVFYQPAFEDPEGNYIVKAEAAYQWEINERLALELGAEYVHRYTDQLIAEDISSSLSLVVQVGE